MTDNLAYIEFEMGKKYLSQPNVMGCKNIVEITVLSRTASDKSIRVEDPVDNTKIKVLRIHTHYSSKLKNKGEYVKPDGSYYGCPVIWAKQT